MPLPLTQDLDFGKFQALNVRVQNLAAAPGTPVAGQIYFDTADSFFKYWNGTEWVVVGGGGGDADSLNGQSGAFYLDRVNHTGDQPASTISDFAEAVDDRVNGLLVAGNQLAATYDDVANSLTLDVEEGPGSGLDADTVDGNEASALLDRTNHSGTQPASTISDFDSEVQTSRLDQMAAPTAAVSMNGQRLTDLPAPGADTDPVRLQDLNDSVEGRDWKQSVRAVATSNLDLTTQGSRTVDGVNLADGDRVLLTGQTDPVENGIYDVQADFSLIRADDADEDADVTAGMHVPVDEGTTNADTLWVLTGNDPLVVDIDALNFSKLSTAEILAGDGLSKTGQTIDVVAGAGINVNGGVSVDTAIHPRMFTQLFGDGAATSFVINHALGNRNVTAQVIEESTGEGVLVQVNRTDANNVTIPSIEASPGTPIGVNAYRIIVMG